MFLPVILLLAPVIGLAPPLDTRIDPSRITTMPAPAAQDEVIPATSAVHRIAKDLADVPMPLPEATRARAALERGVSWLLVHQDTGGGWGGGAMATPTDAPDDPPTPAAAAITGLGIKAVAQCGCTPSTALQPAIERLRLARRADFGIDGGPLTTYVVATITSGLASLQDPAMDDLVQDGVASLRNMQWDQGEGLQANQDWYGGAGYGSRGRPDLSNTQIVLDALHDADVPSDDLAFQRAVVFLTRCQNLNATNPADWAGTDGGFVYTPANGGESLGSEFAGHGRHGNENLAPGEARSLRSYGSMTYAGYKSMLYAGLGPDDPRVHAALDWIRGHWTFASNPGLGQQGYFYYLYTMSRALRASGLDDVIATNGLSHDWRSEMARAIIRRQNDDGSWVNPEDRWLEGRPDLSTIYAVLALEEILKPAASKRSEPATPPTTPKDTQR